MITPNIGIQNPLIEADFSNAYILSSQREGNGRTISRFKLKNSETETLNNATAGIQALLNAQPNLIPTFSIDTLLEQVRVKHYLVVNGSAVCLSDQPAAKFSAPEQYIDTYFSESILNEPIKCSQGHALEKGRANYWKLRGEHCPAGVHLIGDLTTDNDLKYKLDGYKKELEETDKRNKRITDTMDAHSLISTNQAHTIARSAYDIDALKKKRHDKIVFGGTLTKFVIKGVKAESKALLMVAKFFSENASEQVAKNLVKEIPVICFFAGIAFAMYRLSLNQPYRASAEFMSGILANFPGLGTAAAIGIDLNLAMVDFQEIINTQPPEYIEILDIDTCYKILKLDSTPEPTISEVKYAFREQTLLVHPDRLKQLGFLKGLEDDGLFNMIVKAKNEIYRLRNWEVVNETA